MKKNVTLLSASITFLLLLCILPIANAQKALKMTNKESGKSKTYVTGARVIYKVNEVAVTGILNSISDTSLVVDNQEVLLKTLSAFGQKKVGTNASQGVVAFLGGYFIGSAIFARPTEPTPGVVIEPAI
jgi:hypothetical protein